MKSLLVALLLFACVNGNAQTSAKSLYFELGGPGLASINYDMRFNKKDDGLGFRVGVGGYTINDSYSDGYGSYSDNSTALFIPLGLNYLLGKDGKNYFETGAGVTIVSISNSNYNSTDRFSTSFGHLYFGYRLQPKNGGFLFRAGIVPIFNKYGFIPYYAGISFGYKF